MRLAYTILYVQDVNACALLWSEAFGLPVSYVHEDGIYAELATGETTLAFADIEFGRGHFEDAITREAFSRPPSRFEVGLETADIHQAHDDAVRIGFVSVVKPKQKPWGQWVAWLRDPDGILVELSTPAVSLAE